MKGNRERIKYALRCPIAVFGDGVSGRAAARLARSFGAQVEIFEENGALFGPREAEWAKVVVSSPGFSKDHPWLALARKSGCAVVGELDFASIAWPGEIIAVTGSNGKTTVTEFLTKVLREADNEAVATGNIGHPLSAAALENASSSTVAVCEVSSFQAESLEFLRPSSVLWTSFSEDHLDRHADLHEYFEAKANLAKAGNVRTDRKAVIQLRLGNTAEAIKLAESAVKSGVEQARPLAAQAYILHAAGKPAEAKAAFDHLRRIAPQLDLDTECFTRLAPLARSLNLPTDWRQAQPAAKDMGLRPDLDALGPFRWEPSAAPSWTLPDRNNKKFSLTSLRGKPVLLIFYLGKGCLHCMEQLNKFDPVADRFSRQGISIFAVSTDTMSGLKDTLIGYDAKDRHFSFPLLSDPSLEIFKAYRAYDDFEKIPLHGTFLIDGKGKIRWQNISYEPFMAPEFLLEEAKRLLSRP